MIEQEKIERTLLKKITGKFGKSRLPTLSCHGNVNVDVHLTMILAIIA